MKQIFKLSLILAMMAFALPALAVSDIQKKPLFTLLSSAVSATTNSTYVNTGLRTKKTIIVNGMTSATGYGNYSGTFILKGAPTSTGPWVTLKDRGNTTVSATTNTIFVLDDLTQFVMGTYTRGTGRGTKKISAWLYYSE